MTDEPGADRDAQQDDAVDDVVDDAAQERVRRLLADARHDEPAPADVVARLDAALAAERSLSPGPAGAEVADLAARRRGPRGAWLLAAAAAVVVVVGVGATGVAEWSGGDDSTSEQSTAGDAGGVPDQEPPGSRPSRQESRPDGGEQEQPGLMTGSAALPVVRTGPRLAADVERALARSEPAPAGAAARCGPLAGLEDAGAEVYRVRADDGPAALLASAPDGGRREVVLVACDDGPSDPPLATVTVPAS